LQPTQGFLILTKYLQTNLFDIKVKKESISQDHSNVASERIYTVRNSLFEAIEQQPL
jgi:hypothetical protein